jgi:hypothetical protein
VPLHLPPNHQTKNRNEEKMSEVKVGVRFQNMFQDQLLTYEVKKYLGNGVWLCECVNEPLEYKGDTFPDPMNGHEEVFFTSQISLKLGVSSTMERALKGIGL